MTRYYYAVEHAYGSHVLNTNGGTPNRLYRFPSKRARDAWVEAGPTYTKDPGYREGVIADQYPGMTRGCHGSRNHWLTDEETAAEYMTFLE